jgi:hypothetical protein
MNSYTSTRTGKIARLPHPIRHQLNLRLQDNLPAKSILPWLNNLPEVKTLLAAQFNSRPITPQNLSEWKKGGFRDWLTRQDALQFVQNLENQADLEEPALKGNFTDKLTRWLALQYAAATRSVTATENPRARWNRLRELGAEISRLRRADFCSQIIQLKRDRLALDQSNSRQLQDQKFEQWAKDRGIWPKEPEQNGMTKEAMHEFLVNLGLTFDYPRDVAEEMATERCQFFLDRHAADAAARQAVLHKTEPATPPPSLDPETSTADQAATAQDAPQMSASPDPAGIVDLNPAPSRPTPGQSNLIQPKNQEGGSLDTLDSAQSPTHPSDSPDPSEAWTPANRVQSP